MDRTMAEFTAHQIMLCVTAFESAWASLVSDNRVREENIKKLPTLLIAAILEKAAEGELKKEVLMAAGLERVKDFKDEIKD
jgi:hypothetical protein